MPIDAEEPEIAVIEPTRHRTTGSSCSTDPRPDSVDNQLDYISDTCTNDADCTDDPSGRCRTTGIFEPQKICTYHECFEDSDCLNGQVCACGDPALPWTADGAGDHHRCVAATCATDDDCAPFFCAPTWFQCTPELVESYRCTSPADTCKQDSDCDGRTKCTLGANQRFHCAPGVDC